MSALSVGDEVTLLKDIWEDADDCAPGGYLARKGEKLIVRRLAPESKLPIKVSHSYITNNSFGVTADEIEKAKP